MKIIIVGAGFTGTQLARRLIQEKNDVVLIERDEDTARHVSNRLDCLVIPGNGNNLAALKEAGIAKADALVMLTESDEVNMITCSLVDSVYPDVLKIARVRNADYYADLPEELINSENPIYGVDFMIQPDQEAASAIVNAVEHGAVTEVLEFEDSHYELTHITVEKGSALDGETIMNLRRIAGVEFVVAYIESKSGISLPSGPTIIRSEDRLGILTKSENIPHFLKLSGSKLEDIKKIALVGAGRIGTAIAEQLSIEKKMDFFKKLFGHHKNEGESKKRSYELVIIDKDSEKTEEAAEKFPNANTFCADITDESFIEEEDLSSFDLVISATHNHELNMVTCAYFKTLGVPKTIALVTSEGFASMARNIGVDVAVPIKDAVVDSIMSHLRGNSVRDLHTIGGSGEIEIMEFVVPEGAKHSGKALKDIALNGVFLVLMVKKHGEEKFIIPSGNTIVEEGDSVVLICYSKDNKRVIDRLSDAN